MRNNIMLKIGAGASVALALIPKAFAQVSTTTTNTIVSDSLTTLTSILTTNLPLVIGFAVALIGVGLAWKYFRRFVGGRK